MRTVENCVLPAGVHNLCRDSGTAVRKGMRGGRDQRRQRYHMPQKNSHALAARTRKVREVLRRGTDSGVCPLLASPTQRCRRAVGQRPVKLQIWLRLFDNSRKQGSRRRRWSRFIWSLTRLPAKLGAPNLRFVVTPAGLHAESPIATSGKY